MTLLKALQKLQNRLVGAYLLAVESDPELSAQVRHSWEAAEVGGRFEDFVDVMARRSSVQEDMGSKHPTSCHNEGSCRETVYITHVVRHSHTLAYIISTTNLPAWPASTRLGSADPEVDHVAPVFEIFDGHRVG